MTAALLAPAAAPAATAKRAARASALPTFSSCGSLLSFARRNARRTGGTTGVPMRAGAVVPQVLSGPVSVEVLADSAPAAATPTAGAKSEASVPSFSQTNVQEVGVDEPDIIKTDGRHVFAIAGSSLRALDVGGEQPTLVGSLALGEGSGAYELFIRGDRALVMGTSYGAIGFARDIAPSSSQVVISEIDISNPAAMTVRRSMTVDGALVDARLTGGTARVVVGSSPDVVQPAAISRTTARRWVPRTVLRSRLSGRTFRRSVVACDEVRHPRQFSGLDLLTVLTIDLDKGLFNVDRDAIMAGAQTVYASTTGLYVASQRYIPALEAGRALPETMRTEIHRFDTSKPDETSYASTGEVTGFVLNQYSLSEFEGALRVASTEEPQWFDGAQTGESQSYVTVLAERGSRLAPLGRVGGLGKGERIYAVRFVGDKGYVVTFRQVDPLFTLDLSDKADPRVLGELKIQGFSAYLHPISDDLLLGVGQDASAQGRTLGTQLSLFDVSDLRNPVRRAVASLGGNSTSDAEFDPHAFLFWKPSDLAVIPLQTFGPQGQGFVGAVGFHVGAAAIDEAGRVTHPKVSSDFAPPIGRSLVIGDRLYTLSFAGLAANRLDTLAPVAFEAFPQEGSQQPVPQPIP
ncbi:MAG TPA: beta-propeller domain-containing protein [Solirubrobacteraceae bacterium]|nr:beta-propeller domain-containing protein [Solirubrobacteraceae bacterium]